MFSKVRSSMFSVLMYVLTTCVVGCAAPKLDGFKEPKLVERAEVIRAQKDCIDAKMKPVIQSLPQKTDHGTIMLPVAVTCETYTVRQ
jgi:hypothetical protein